MRRVASWAGPFLALASLFAGCSKSDAVVVYCALDREYAEPVLKAFTQKTGIEVKAQFDVEMTKTVGLVKAIEEEKDRPRCDVFWNNEILHTLRLQKLGILAPYVPPTANDLPAAFKEKDGYWHGFAARARILIVNTDKMPDKTKWPTSFHDFLKPEFKGKAALAKPLAGTTLTHMSALYTRLGAEATDRFLDAALKNDLIVTPGNAMVARQVRDGQAWFGFTDTDDFHVALADGGHVAAVYPDDPSVVEGGIGALVIPNTVAIVKGGPHPEHAKKLVEYLLSTEVEKMLAESDSVQIPVRPNVLTPPAVKRFDEFAAMSVDWWKVAEEYDKRIQGLEAKFNR